jgi:transglutaminase-like putative cysteine protease
MFLGDVLAVPQRDEKGNLIKDDAGNVVTVKGAYYLKVNLPEGTDSITLTRGQIINLRTPTVFFENIIRNTKKDDIRLRAQDQLSKTPAFVALKADINDRA